MGELANREGQVCTCTCMCIHTYTLLEKVALLPQRERERRIVCTSPFSNLVQRLVNVETLKPDQLS